MLRRTKIIATLGPATDDPKVVSDLIAAGVDLVRVNLSHGTHAEHLKRVETVRGRARAMDRAVGILADLQGPKIRIGTFRSGTITLTEGDDFILDEGCSLDGGDQGRVGVTLSRLSDDVSRGDTLLLDDGRIVLWVSEVAGGRVHCKVMVGGALSGG